MENLHDKVRDRLMAYARINTESSNHSESVPTTRGQMDLGRALYSELHQIGIKDCCFDEESCIVYAHLPKSAKVDTYKTLGLIAHMDTAPDAPGEGCKPWELKNYDRKDIVLNKDKNIIMGVDNFPELKNYIGQDLILTDGTTLLGGDDKASIATIMTYLEILIKEEIPHGPISVAFTPDEEVGGLAKNLDLKKFDSSTAYTLDGDHLGWYMDETFNADAVHLEFHGFSVHTGTAKGKLKNALIYSAEFINMLPENQRPETTEGMEGFYFIHEASGNAEHVVVEMIIRDFDMVSFDQRREFLTSCVKSLNDKYGDGTVEISFTKQYRSMKEAVSKEEWMIDCLKKAISECGIVPHKEAFRGGTDGSALSNRGLPCPNLSAGYENAHGRFEYVPVQSMMKNVDILMKLTNIFLNMSSIDKREDEI